MTPADGSSLISQLRRTLRDDVLECAPDEQLLEQFVVHRDEAAFAALVRRHGRMVWAICQRVLVHRQDAEDAFQATFLVLARKAASIGQRSLLANWLFGVARRAALNLRAMRARRAHHEQLCADPPDIHAMLETSGDDLRTVLDEELARLPAKYRLPLLLCGLEDMTHAEAAKVLGWPTGTVAGRLARGRALLRTRLLRRGVAVPAAVLAGVLAPDAALAAVPPQLVTASVRSAALIAHGQSVAVAASPAAAALMRCLLMKMFLARVWTITALLTALAMSLGGAGAMWQFLPSAEMSRPAFGRLARNPLHSAAPPPLASLPPGPNPPDTPSPGKLAIRLPADPNAVVVRMDRFVDPSKGPRLALTIYADGRVVAELPDSLVSLSATELTRIAKEQRKAEESGSNLPPLGIKVVEGKLSPRDLQDLVRFALQEQEFFEFDPDEVHAAIRDTYHLDGSVIDPTDATTTAFRIQTADHHHEVSWLRLTKGAWDFPRVDQLLQLHALDCRLTQVFSVLLAGGAERVEAVVAKMNALVEPYYRLYPDVSPLTAADLYLVTPSADGSAMKFLFSRNKDKLVRNPLFEVCLDVPAHGEPQVCYVIPPGKRFRGRVVDLLGFLPP